MIDRTEISDAVQIAATPRPVTKDSGRVKIGGGAIHFSDPAPKATKDSGRVKIGGGAIVF